MTTYLYIKTHKITGLKYLGKTTQDPFKYKGSGIRWCNHLNVHGDEHDTEILMECQTKEEVKQWGLYYSELWDVVKSPEWANLKPENGDGGGVKGIKRTAEFKNKVSASQKGKTHTAKSRTKMSVSQLGKLGPWLGKTRSKETREKISDSLKDNIPWNKGLTGLTYSPRSEETKAKHRALRWYNNGEKNIKTSGEPPAGFVAGRVKINS
jgi:hypothetical protein